MKLKHTLTSCLLMIPLLASANGEHASKADLGKFYDQVLIVDSQKLQQNCETLSQALQQKQSAKQLAPKLGAMLTAWKAVENNYLLDNIDDDLIDEPRYIDIFHHNDLKRNDRELERAMQGNSKPADALFKNAHKTVNALEYVLYAPHSKVAADRQNQFALYINQSLCKRFAKINTAYQQDRALFLQEPDQRLAQLINHLIDGTYALKEWRVGDVIGASKKYLNRPDIKRSEYRHSHNSIAAILQILKSHQQLFNQSNGLLLPMVKTAENGAILQKIDQILSSAIAVANDLPKGFESDPQKLLALFNHVSALHKAYYEQLIDSLDIVSSILEADGD